MEYILLFVAIYNPYNELKFLKAISDLLIIIYYVTYNDQQFCVYTDAKFDFPD